ncbi:beta-galactosidase 9-like [Humulus lupulus]|uniref:beta-galactosidase 9-like n=1 Tax=Humulus lupulus TaxID=3486 RepID=UPI002B40EF21|nr:beta-galactosidase 9-like [Humulus lupulus]XP_062117528.1 beta-galactosidase 9-like [Humulus lupulus]
MHAMDTTVMVIGQIPITNPRFGLKIGMDGLLSEPKWGHLKDLHAAIKLCEPSLVAADSPQYIKLGPKQENYGAFLEKDGAGFRGQVKLTGFQNGDIDLSKSLWTYQVGLKGEFLKIYAAEENEKAGWTDLTPDADPSILTI